MTKSLYHRTITTAGTFVREWHIIIAAALLAAMFGLSLGAMAGDSAIVDEVAHIPAAYSYLHYGDYRLNPEHPPLIKDLAGLPLQFMDLKFPDGNAAWTTDVNGQWESGWSFIYYLGNDAAAILFWARLPILLLAIGFGIVLYRFCYRRWGVGVGLLTLFFYCLSPNLIAHSHYVTTDLGASVFLFLALVAFVRFTEHGTRANLFLLALALAVAQLSKFSAVLLFPFLGAVCLALALSARRDGSGRGRKLIGGFLLASVMSVLMVWLFYVPQTIAMPQEVQDRLIRGSMVLPGQAGLVDLMTSLNDNAAFKPLVQYVLGIAMVFGRVAGGNVTYFNGQISNQSYHLYFPELFLMKTQIAFLVLGAASIVSGLVLAVRRPPITSMRSLLMASWRGHRMEWTLGGFAAYYFAFSVAGNLNLGIRHILPIYVPLFVVVAVGTVGLVRRLSATRWRTVTVGMLVVLLGWYGVSTAVTYPSYTSYFNEFAGGANGADRYFSDSSVDWGQDLLRLKTYVTDHPEIKHIAVDYFGGAIPAYYFCDRKYDANGRLVSDYSGFDCSHSVYQEWHSSYGTYTGQYIAISETYLENDRYYSALAGAAGYESLRAMKPMAKIGGSIFVYKLY